jgi:hypothetical protein
METNDTLFFCRVCNAMKWFVLATTEDGTKRWYCEECSYSQEFDDEEVEDETMQT